MTREEILLNKFSDLVEAGKESGRAFRQNPAIIRMDPFKMADNLYYVGDKKVCIHLIDTGEGLVLIDSGYLGTAHLLVDSIWRLGFDPKNVKWIIHSHCHHDHFGASSEFRVMYGTKLAMGRVDAELTRQLPRRSHISNSMLPHMETPIFDLELEDGDVFELGRLRMRCVLTPGHTDGTLSFFFEVTVDGEKHLAGMFGGAGTNALKLPYLCYNQRGEDSLDKMIASIDMIMKEPVDLHLGNHPGNNDTLGKREKQIKEGGNPFVSKDSWQKFLLRVKDDIAKVRELNAETEKEIEKILKEQI